MSRVSVKTKRRMYHSQGGRCCYCDKPMFLPGAGLSRQTFQSRYGVKNRDVDDRRATFEHYIPKSQGGTNTDPRNAIACLRCNHARGSAPRWLFHPAYVQSHGHKYDLTPGDLQMHRSATNALSIRQPWAWAVIHAGKDIENRGKAPPGTDRRIGKPFAIHAATGMTQIEYRQAAEFMTSIGIIPPRPDHLVRGAIIGSVRLVDVVSESDSPWWMGPRGLVLSEPTPVVRPIPCLGQLGWFNWRKSGEIRPPLPWMRAYPDHPNKQNLDPERAGDLFISEEGL